jgi:hypothetical protein
VDARAGPERSDVVKAIGVAQRRARLSLRHYLVRPTTSAERVAAELAGLHSSDPPTPFLASWARVKDFAPEELDDALYERKTLLRMIGMRRTLFVEPLDLAAVIDVACTKALVRRERSRLARMLEEHGHVRPGGGERWIERASARTLEVLRERGEAAARELTKEIPELGVKFTYGEGTTWAGSMGGSTRILFLLSIEGKVSRSRPVGTFASGQYRWAPMDAWLERPLPEVDLATASAELVRRWLATFGPGTMRDIRWWTGWTARLTASALEAVEAVEVRLGDERGYVLPDDLEPVGDVEPWVALLPGLDPTVMGWKDRDWYLRRKHVPLLFDVNGNAGPTVWSNGRVVGGWWQDDAGRIVVKLLSRVDAATRRAVNGERERLEAWLGDVRLRLRFPTPLERSLRSS